MLNICGLTNKELGIVEFMTKHRISIMVISDVRRKDTGTKKGCSNFILIWSGVNKDLRVSHGDGFIKSPSKAKNLLSTEYILERLITDTIVRTMA